MEASSNELAFAGPTLRMKACGNCGSRFSGDARFCPFDGEALSASNVENVDPLIGTLVDGRYDVLAVLGEGGMGKVYRVRHRAIERLFALKVLRADLAADSELGVRFTREARAAASISHPNVVQITDFGSLPSGQPYFVMELLPGQSLSDLLSTGGPLTLNRAVRLLAQIVDALVAAHAVGVIHRDLKPDNVVVFHTGSGSESAKVLDFGLAKVAGQSRLTREGLVFGTPHYMSPEQASGTLVDHRADIYALGVMMYQVLTGRVPFEADTYMGVLTQHIYVEPAPPSQLVGTASLGALEQIVLRCLEKKPERRFQSMGDLREELRRVARFDASGAVAIKPVEPQERSYAPQVMGPFASAPLRNAGPAKGLSRGLLVLLGVAVLVVSGLAAFFALSIDDGDASVTQGGASKATPSATVATAKGPPPPTIAAPLGPVAPAPLDSAAARAIPLDVIPVDAPTPSHSRRVAHPESPRAAPPGPPERPSEESVKQLKTKEKIGDDGIVDPWAN